MMEDPPDPLLRFDSWVYLALHKLRSSLLSSLFPLSNMNWNDTVGTNCSCGDTPCPRVAAEAP